METMINAWLSIWLYVMLGIGVFLAIKIYKNRKTWDKINILCTLAVIVLVLHVIEEWVFPGGLHYSYNFSHGSTDLARYPMNRLTDMITNFGGVILGCIVLKFWGFRKPAGIAVMLFSAFEVVIHIIIGINSLDTFGKYGMQILYSPGLVTSLFGFLPISVCLGIHLLKKENRATIKQWIIAIVVMFGFCFLLINLPEMVLGSENSPYAFTDRGFYEKYAEEFEKDNGYKYDEYEILTEAEKMNEETMVAYNKNGIEMTVTVRGALSANSPCERYTGYKPEILLLKSGGIGLKGLTHLLCNIILGRDIPIKLRDGVTIHTGIFVPIMINLIPQL